MAENTIILTTDDATAVALVSTIKAAVNGAGKYVAYVKTHNVTRANVKDHAVALATLAYPNDKPVQTYKDEEGKKVRTRFGNAVQAAAAGLRVALGEDMTKKPVDWLKMVKQAAQNAHEKGNVSEDAIMAAVKDALRGE